MNGQRREEEYKAREILLRYFYNRYEALEIADKPDLQNIVKSIGVEVVAVHLPEEGSFELFESMVKKQDYKICHPEKHPSISNGSCISSVIGFDEVFDDIMKFLR